MAFCGLVTGVCDLIFPEPDLFGDDPSFSKDFGALDREALSFSEDVDLSSSSFSKEGCETRLGDGDSVFLPNTVIGFGSELSLW